MDAVAAYDVLAVADELDEYTGPLARGELHVVLYLALALGIYSGLQPEDWGYQFVSTPAGVPYSTEVDNSIGYLAAQGLLASHDGLFASSVDGRAEAKLWETVVRYRQRRMYIRGASGVAAVMPITLIVNAIATDPQLRAAIRQPLSKVLFDETGLSAITAHFDAVREVVGTRTVDTTLPATLWIAYLADQAAIDIPHLA
jgi:hypothetical protein